jgi:hypothetical protein
MQRATFGRLGLLAMLTALIAVLSGTTALLGQGSFTATGDRSWCSASQALSV